MKPCSLSALSASGSPNLAAPATAVAGGGMAGDRVATGKMAVARAKAEWALLRYGAVTILAGRLLPCGRAATTWTSGSVALPLNRFRMFSALASMAWAAYMIGLGRLGGSAFADMPLLGTAIGLGIGTILTGAYRLVEKRRTAIGSNPREVGPAGQKGLTVKASVARLALPSAPRTRFGLVGAARE